MKSAEEKETETETNSNQSQSVPSKDSNAWKYLKSQLEINPNFDYVFVGNKGDYGVEFNDPIKKKLFRTLRYSAASGNQSAVGQMFRMMKDLVLLGHDNDYGVGQLKEQLIREYEIQVDWSKLETS